MPRQLNENEAKQGRGGRPLLIIMICALLLAAAVWWGVEWYGESIDAGQQVELQKSTDAPETPTGPVGSGDSQDETQTPPAE